MANEQENKTPPMTCPHGVGIRFICYDCMNPFEQDNRKNEDLRAKFRFTEQIG